MRLGEKLQQLRKQSGLSQEQLAAQLTVSRQAVSKWELNETMPDTENVVQLSRLFGVSCDYLLRDEADGQGGAVQPAAPEGGHLPSANDRPGGASAAPEGRHSPSVNDRPGGASAAHLDEKGWTHNAFTLSLGLCALGLATAFIFDRLNGHTVRPLVIGFMIQALGIVLFELATPRMTNGRAARLNFYTIACWLVLPVPVMMLLSVIFEFFLWSGTPLMARCLWLAVYLLLCAAVTAALSILRRRMAAKN